MQDVEDETEYFGFPPVAFTSDIQASLEEAVAEILQRAKVTSPKVRAQLSESLRKNLFIFNNFVLRNILKFPPGFKLERKISDLKIHGDPRELSSALSEAQGRVSARKSEYSQLFAVYSTLKTKNAAYRSLLQDAGKYIDMADAAREVKKYMQEVSAVYEQFKISACGRDGDFESLMEFKGIKSDYYLEERARLLDIADLDVLEHFGKCVGHV